MNWKAHLPLAIATGALILTIAICTLALFRELEDVRFDIGAIDSQIEALSRR